MRLSVVFFLIFIVAGCATREQGQYPSGQHPSGTLPKAPRATYNLTGYSPAFKEGYIDGCETAKKTSYGLKDERRFSADNQYRMGWNDGFSVCRGKQ